MNQKLSVLEIYSGIGGMHWALKRSGVDYEIVMAVDINTTANMIYKHNFPSTNLQCFGLEKMTLQKLERLSIDTILMSPPCQPFTRVGKKGDCEDVRTKSFLHILKLIREMKVKPMYLLVENVKGFETSQTHQKLIECLKDCGYTYQEFMLTPLQFGIPNCRLRYYLIARHKNPFTFLVQSEILTNVPKNIISLPAPDPCSEGLVSHDNVEPHAGLSNVTDHELANTSSRNAHYEQICSCTSKTVGSYGLSSQQPVTSQSFSHLSACSLTTETAPGLSSCTEHFKIKQENSAKIRCDVCELKDAGRNMRYCEEDDDLVNETSLSLSDFMESATFDELKDYWLSDRELRLFVVMDVVFPALKKSTCFTKRYGHYVDGAGSVVQMTSNVENIQAASKLKSCAVELKNRAEWGDAELNIIRKLKLRYFTPREVANLLCFPPEFDFPSGVSNIQKYRVLGNSLNVHVVAKLIKMMAQ